MTGLSFDDLVVPRPAPPNRVGASPDGTEHHLHEGAVMVAYAMHLLSSEGARAVAIHPDGEHGKQFDFRAWLAKRGFSMTESRGKTTYSGTYRDAEGRMVVIDPKSGLHDVVADLDGRTQWAECKGGIVHTRHPGQRSRLYRGLCEAVGLLMTGASEGRQVAVVPYTEVTDRLAARLAPRCAAAGIEIALVKHRGEVAYVTTPGPERKM